MILRILKRVHFKRCCFSIPASAIFLLFVLTICTGRIIAQAPDYTHLEKLVSGTEQMMYPATSENGKWMAWYIASADGSKKLMAQNVDCSESRIERKYISYMIFVKNHLLIQTGDQVEYINPETGKSLFLYHVNKYVYDKKHQVLVMLVYSSSCFNVL